MVLLVFFLVSAAGACEEVSCLRLCEYLGERGSYDAKAKACVCGRVVSAEPVEVRRPVIRGELKEEDTSSEREEVKEPPRQWWED